MADDPRRDLARLDEVLGVVEAYEKVRDALPEGARSRPAYDARWLIEELRLGLFAPSVRTADRRRSSGLAARWMRSDRLRDRRACAQRVPSRSMTKISVLPDSRCPPPAGP